MNKAYPFVELQNLLSSAQSVFVALPTGCNFDQVATGLSLYLALAKSGKQVSVLAPEEMTVGFSHLVAVDKISTKASGGDLMITIDVPIGNIEKVTSKDDGGKLNLIVRAKSGMPPVQKEEILFSSIGGEADLIFVIEAKKLESLGKIYRENENLFREKPVVHISHYGRADALGQVNVIDPSASCASEIMVSLLQGLNLSIDEDIGQNLLLGLHQATANFQSSATTADTFEAAAICLRSGGGRPVFKKDEEEAPSEAVSPDWFEPKIYKGSTLP